MRFYGRRPGTFSTKANAGKALNPILSPPTSQTANLPCRVNGVQDRVLLFYLERLAPDPEVEEEPPLLLPEPLEPPEPKPAPGVTGLLVLLEPPLLPLSLEDVVSLSLELSLLELLVSLEPLPLPELPWLLVLLPLLPLLPLEPEEPPGLGVEDEEEEWSEALSVPLLAWVAPLPLPPLPEESPLLLPEEPYCCWP